MVRCPMHVLPRPPSSVWVCEYAVHKRASMRAYKYRWTKKGRSSRRKNDKIFFFWNHFVIFFHIIYFYVSIPVYYIYGGDELFWRWWMDRSFLFAFEWKSPKGKKSMEKIPVDHWNICPLFFLQFINSLFHLPLPRWPCPCFSSKLGGSPMWLWWSSSISSPLLLEQCCVRQCKEFLATLHSISGASVRLSLSLYLYQSIYLSIYLSIDLSIYLSVSVPLFLSFLHFSFCTLWWHPTSKTIPLSPFFLFQIWVRHSCSPLLGTTCLLDFPNPL